MRIESELINYLAELCLIAYVSQPRVSCNIHSLTWHWHWHVEWPNLCFRMDRLPRTSLVRTTHLVSYDAAAVGMDPLPERETTAPFGQESMWTRVKRCLCPRPTCTEVAMTDLIREAEAVAYAPDHGLYEFSEKFKYTIATSYLLAPTLSISMYERRSDDEQMRPSKPNDSCPHTNIYRVPFPNAQHHVSGSIRPAIPLIHATGAVILFCALIAFRVPIAYVILMMVALDALTLMPVVSESALWRPRTLSFYMSSPPTKHPSFLAANVPNPIWMADERVRLQACILLQVQEFVAAAQAMDHSINDALAAVQEVELVSRGHKLTSPLAPISRIETAAYMGDEGMPQMRRATYPQRLVSLRKEMVDALEESTYFCDAARRRLEKHQVVGDDQLARGLTTVRHKPKRGELTLSTSPTPRTLSLTSTGTPTHTPYRKAQLPTATYSSQTEPSDILHHRSLISPLPGRSDVSDESPGGYFQQRPSGQDRLTLLSLRTGFEGMHSARQSLLYVLLCLDWDRMHAHSTYESLLSFWNTEVLQGVLNSLTTHFRHTAQRMNRQLEQHMIQDTTPMPSTSTLLHHVGMGDCMTEMARMLRTIQCKLHVCGEELDLKIPSLHGMPNPSQETTHDEDKVRTVFESMREDLLALSSEWEAGSRILDPKPPELSPPAVEIPHFPETKSTMLHLDEDAQPISMLSDEKSEFQSGKHDSYMLHSLLLDSTSPSHLPAATGQEEVFEGSSRSFGTRRVPPVSMLPRAERIRLMNEKRRKRADRADEFQPHFMVNELKGVLKRRTDTMPYRRSTTPPTPTTTSSTPTSSSRAIIAP